MRHWDTWSGLCVELLGGDGMDLVEDGLLDGVAGDDRETARVSFLFCDSVTTAVWVGVWEVVSAEDGEKDICRAAGHAWWATYKTSLANIRELDEDESLGNSEEMGESKGWGGLPDPEAAPFVSLYRGRGEQGGTGGMKRSRLWPG